ncbi:MAG: GNAT family N-acetyltransferase [Candidatus Heimdallarchaeota archaeon]|nr:MAG: GNAT family N-acetyltransferase [Candidatus Heimdallarchaeota archaeon]
MIGRHSFNWERDFENVQIFLGEVLENFSILNWIPSRLENIRFGPCGSEYSSDDVKGLRIWAIESKIVALAITERIGLDYYIQTHPKFKFLEKDIVLWIEKQGRENKQKKPKQIINIFALENDEERITLLKTLEYQNLGLWEYNRKRSLTLPVPDYKLPNGYTIRSIRVEEDYRQLKEVLTSVFPHCSAMTEQRFRLFATASFYNQDLDLVVVAPDGVTFTAFCTIRMDPLSRIAELEPVGTHPNYRRLGLAKAVICEGLQRLMKYHPSMICISGAATTDAANELYDSLGFNEKFEVHKWQKIV